jgi:hypothetical protein
MSSSASDSSVPADQLSSALLRVLTPSLQTLSTTLVELQESQQVLVSTITAKREELLESSPEWRKAQAVLERIPEYQAKLIRIQKAKAAIFALGVKVERGSAVLRGKMEEREKERTDRRGADAAGFAAVADS